VKSGAALLGLGWLAVVVQGALAHLWAAHWVPDVALLFTVAAALLLGPGTGLVVAAALGLGADMVSGTLLGQLACLRLVELGFTRVVAAQLDLRRGLPLAIFAFAMVVLDAAGQAGLSRLFLGSFPVQTEELLTLGVHAAVTAPFAPFVGSLARRLCDRLDEGDARRELRLDPRRAVMR
jgi:rod shape-determining protein MreD